MPNILFRIAFAVVVAILRAWRVGVAKLIITCEVLRVSTTHTEDDDGRESATANKGTKEKLFQSVFVIYLVKI